MAKTEIENVKAASTMLRWSSFGDKGLKATLPKMPSFKRPSQIHQERNIESRQSIKRERSDSSITESKRIKLEESDDERIDVTPSITDSESESDSISITSESDRMSLSESSIAITPVTSDGKNECDKIRILLSCDALISF